MKYKHKPLHFPIFLSLASTKRSSVATLGPKQIPDNFRDGFPGSPFCSEDCIFSVLPFAAPHATFEYDRITDFNSLTRLITIIMKNK